MAAVRNGGNFCAICPRDAMMDPDARGLAVYFETHPVSVQAFAYVVSTSHSILGRLHSFRGVLGKP